MRRLSRLMCLLAFTVSACNVAVVPGPQTVPAGAQPRVQGMPPGEARAAFAAVAQRVEPVSERECRARTQGLNCDFLIRIDPNPNAAPNAYQSLDRNGRPVITFTQRMLAQIANRDELAFVMSHEAAHHIRGHLARQQQNAVLGSVVGAGLATIAGASGPQVTTARDLGASVGARRYSKGYELEADELGTIITHKAGFRPSVGVLFFNRLPDPGDRFLGTHPANPDRVRVVHQTIQAYGLN
ncbi:M48 family metalloprotease [Cribrihabitans neustonicus]|uniref:M48 family metalloprotease n=1 Tax=Cribrihabitans neustonicus TaxID=1429085 RepID=UPI003B5BD257